TTAPGASPLRILLVEDAADNREVIAMFLEGGRYEVDLAENGAVGVERFLEGHYDLVLMDIHMPVMDGYRAAVAIRQWEREREQSSTPIIALTADAFPEDVELALGAGCTAHMAKPVRKAALLEAISAHTAPESNQAA
ncbi:MAG: response regulator, partial [Vicinamibacterales bacterium]